MSGDTNTESLIVECTRIDITPAEAFWQTDPYIHQSKDKPYEKPNPIPNRGFNKEAWNRKRTPGEIDRIDATRAREAEDYIMMCLKPGCVMYGTFDKCEHNIVRMRNTTVLFSKP